MFVVHGATRARRSREIATSCDKTTTGRRPMSAASHHHTSPWAGNWVTTIRPRFEPPKAETYSKVTCAFENCATDSLTTVWRASSLMPPTISFPEPNGPPLITVTVPFCPSSRSE